MQSEARTQLSRRMLEGRLWRLGFALMFLFLATAVCFALIALIATP